MKLLGWVIERDRDRERDNNAALGQAYLEGREAGWLAAHRGEDLDVREVEVERDDEPA